jgi:hypothetical protein
MVVGVGKMVKFDKPMLPQLVLALPVAECKADSAIDTKVGLVICRGRTDTRHDELVSEPVVVAMVEKELVMLVTEVLIVVEQTSILELQLPVLPANTVVSNCHICYALGSRDTPCSQCVSREPNLGAKALP